MLGGVGHPSHGFSVMASTGAEILIVRDGLYVPVRFTRYHCQYHNRMIPRSTDV